MPMAGNPAHDDMQLLFLDKLKSLFVQPSLSIPTIFSLPPLLPPSFISSLSFLSFFHPSPYYSPLNKGGGPSTDAMTEAKNPNKFPNANCINSSGKPHKIV